MSRTVSGRDADLRVHTFREGVLAPVGHDLEIEVPDFSVTVHEDGRVSGVAQLDSLRVVGALHEGHVDERALGRRDRSKIEASTKGDVLATRRHPTARFEGEVQEEADDGSVDVAGALTVHGVTRNLRVRARPEGRDLVARFTLDQREHGIKPFTAMFGALKVRADVEIAVRVRDPR